MKTSLPSATLRVVALAGAGGLPVMMRGIAESFSPRGWSSVPSGDHDRLSIVRFDGDDDVGTQKPGSILLTSLNDPGREARRVLERMDDPSARQAIAAADLIVLGPGSVYTNLLPVLLIPEIAEEIGRSRARVVFVMNLMTEPGETDGFVASDCVRTIRQHAPEVPVYDVLLNDAPIPSDLVVSYARQGVLPIGYDTDALGALGCRPLKCDLLWNGPAVRHDPRKTWRALLGLVADVEAWARDRPRVRAAQSVTEAFV
jgi:2-phospho-L-lactate transferase/gluconeogenesis factor (CofD/UPF0052 family)